MAVADDVAAERRRLVARLRGLPAEQWQTPSLCRGWTVHHVLAHLNTPFLVGRAAMMLRFLRCRGISGGMNATAHALAERPPEELLDLLEANAASTFAPPGLGPVPPLVESVVHSVDIRWSLGDPQQDWGEPARLRPMLDFLVGPRALAGFVPRGRAAGLHLVATDQPWEHGRGVEVRGPSLALAVGLLGREPALAQLEGEGVSLLAGRLR